MQQNFNTGIASYFHSPEFPLPSHYSVRYMHSPVIIRRGICTPPVFIRREKCTPLAILTLPYNLLLRCSAIGQVLDSIDAIFFYSVPFSLILCIRVFVPSFQSSSPTSSIHYAWSFLSNDLLRKLCPIHFFCHVYGIYQ